MTSANAKDSAVKHRIWSEFVSYSELASERVIGMLREFDVEVLVAVMPENVLEIADLCQVYGEAGVQIGVWPMIADEDGRWASTYNAQAYAAFVESLLPTLRSPMTIAVDLEPPIDLLRGLLHGKLGAYQRILRSANWSSGRQRLQDLLRMLSTRGFSPIAAANPMLLSDKPGQSAWQWLFGTPVQNFPFDAVSFMSYTSLLEGYSRGLVNREFARSILVHSARSAVRQLGSRASISIGSVGGGALGDERPYRNLSELADDVGLVRACGVQDVALFDLSGVLAKPNPEVWLAAFAGPSSPVELPRELNRTLALKRVIKGGGYSLASYRHFRHKLVSR